VPNESESLLRAQFDQSAGQPIDDAKLPERSEGEDSCQTNPNHSCRSLRLLAAPGHPWTSSRTPLHIPFADCYLAHQADQEAIVKQLLPHILLTVASLTGLVAPAAADDTDLQYQLYLDAGYVGANREPEDHDWQGKSTTRKLNEANVNLAMANLWKAASTDSRWGFELGVQAGEDSKGLVPPPEAIPASNADELRHLYRANVSYLLGKTGALKIGGGLFRSYIGHESFLAAENPNYSRAYITDAIPYFLTGVAAEWEVSKVVDLGFYVVNGFNHLADPNNKPSYGLQGKFGLTDRTIFTQNFYYGPDQEETDQKYWRFYSNSIIEWESERLKLAASFDFGNEKQADLPDEPRAEWANTTIWIDWTVNDKMSLGLRPEYHKDTDGALTGNKQTIKALTGTLKYEWLPPGNRIVTMLEARYDRSTGEEGGFPDENGQVAEDQVAILAGFIWSFTR